jgi:hypothetical protein
MVGIICYFCFSIIVFMLLFTFVEYVAFIFSGVVSTLFGSTCVLCIWLCLYAWCTAYVLLPGIRFLYCFEYLVMCV